MVSERSPASQDTGPGARQTAAHDETGTECDEEMIMYDRQAEELEVSVMVTMVVYGLALISAIAVVL